MSKSLRPQIGTSQANVTALKILFGGELFITIQANQVIIFY